MVLSEASTNDTILANIRSSPQAISPAIGFSTFNLRPFSPAVITPTVTVGLIYLIIMAFFSFGFFMPIHMKFMSPVHRTLKFYQLIIWRWCSTIMAYFFISLSYSLVSLSFQISFSKPATSEIMVGQPANAYHYGSFPVYCNNFETSFWVTCWPELRDGQLCRHDGPRSGEWEYGHDIGPTMDGFLVDFLGYHKCVNLFLCHYTRTKFLQLGICMASAQWWVCTQIDELNFC